MDAEKNRQILTYKPQLLVLSSMQEHPSTKTSNKPTVKSTVADVDSELGVFRAEKYFSMKLDHVDSTVDIINQKEKENKQNHPYPHPQMIKTSSTRSITSRHGTSSVRSESSYNSETFLMRFNSINDNKQRKTNETSVSFGGFRCYGPCSGVKTVNTDRKISGKGSNYDREFVAYDARKHINKPRLHLGAKKADNPEPQKISIPIPKSDMTMSAERKLSSLTWDAIPNHNPSMSSKTQEEETRSEASSELFEIENITSSVYEPSEASIGWSVVTGSIADQSDFDMMKRDKRSGSVVKTKPVVAEKVRSGGFLSGCKSYKAVSVVDSSRNIEETAKVDHHDMSQKKKFKTEIRIQDLSFL